MTFDDILGLPNTKNYCIDTSLFGDVELELQFNDNTSFKASRAGTVTQVNAVSALNARFANIRLCVNTVVSISPLYVSLLSARISGSEQAIRIPFQNLISQFAANTGSNRLTVNSGCVDALMIVPFTADPNTHGVYAAANALSADPPRYKYAVNDAAANFSVSVGSEQFPRQPVQNWRDCADITTNSIYGNSTKSTNLLYHAQTAAGA